MTEVKTIIFCCETCSAKIRGLLADIPTNTHDRVAKAKYCPWCHAETSCCPKCDHCNAACCRTLKGLVVEGLTVDVDCATFLEKAV